MVVGCAAGQPYGTTVQIVNWWTLHFGRFAHLDNSNRVKYIVPVGEHRDPKDLRTGTIVIVPDLGIRMTKPRGRAGGLRPLMPEWAMQLRDMWHLVQASHLSAEIVADCSADGETVSSGLSNCPCCGEGDTDLKCAVCLLCWHRGCSSTMLAEFGSPAAFRTPEMRIVWDAFADAAGIDQAQRHVWFTVCSTSRTANLF